MPYLFVEMNDTPYAFNMQKSLKKYNLTFVCLTSVEI